MFVFLCWKNSEGKDMKTLLPVDKATKLAEQLELKGTKTWFKHEELVVLN